MASTGRDRQALPVTEAEESGDHDEEAANDDDAFEGAEEVEGNDDGYWEEEEEEEDDDDEATGLRVRALPSDGDPDYASGPPADGLEYLRRVRAEASTVPDVMIAAAVDPRAFDHKRTAYVPSTATRAPPSTPAHARPDPRWRRAFLAAFSDLRATVARAVAGARGAEMSSAPRTSRREGVHDANHALAAASEAGLAGFDDEEAPASEEEEEVVEDRCPPLSLLLEVDDVTCASLLRRHCLAMGDALLGDEVVSPPPRLMRRRATWFYALSARVGLPLDADTAAAMRTAARALAAARAAVAAADDLALPHLQVCLAIAGKYFGQGEPGDRCIGDAA